MKFILIYISVILLNFTTSSILKQIIERKLINNEAHTTKEDPIENKPTKEVSIENLNDNSTNEMNLEKNKEERKRIILIQAIEQLENGKIMNTENLLLKIDTKNMAVTNYVNVDSSEFHFIRDIIDKNKNEGAEDEIDKLITEETKKDKAEEAIEATDKLITDETKKDKVEEAKEATDKLITDETKKDKKTVLKEFVQIVCFTVSFIFVLFCE